MAARDRRSPSTVALQSGVFLGTVWGILETALLVGSGTNIEWLWIGYSVLFEIVVGFAGGLGAALLLLIVPWNRLRNRPVALTVFTLAFLHACIIVLVQLRHAGRPILLLGGFAAFLVSLVVGGLWWRREARGLLGNWYLVLGHALVTVAAFSLFRLNHSYSYRFGEAPLATTVPRDVLIFSGAAVLWILLGRFRGRSAGEVSSGFPAWSASILGLLLAGVLLIGGVRSLWGLDKPMVNLGPAQDAFPEGPGMILIVMDTARRDHLSCYGYDRDTTPRIDEFANDAVLYERAVAPSPWTLPSHASLFTGLFPFAHGAHFVMDATGTLSAQNLDAVRVTSPARPLSSRALTLAEIFRDGGYVTGAICGNTSYLHRAFGLFQGFWWYDDRRPMMAEFRSNAFIFWQKLRRQHYDLHNSYYRDAARVTDDAINWLKREKDSPFFLFINYMDPHEPYSPPPPYDRKFPGTYSGFRDPEIPVMSGERDITPREKAHMEALYDGEIAFMDEHIGRLLDYLRKEGLYDTVPIVITSDHGECFGGHRLLYHANAVYQSEVAAALLVRVPGHSPGRESRRVQLIDLFPTILGWAGLPTPDGIHGQPLDSVTRPSMTEFYPSSERIHRFGDRFNRMLRAVYRDNLKCILSSTGQPEVYDLALDPGETSNIAAQHPEMVDYARNAVDGFLGAWDGDLISGEPMELDDEVVDRLRGVGYLGGRTEDSPPRPTDKPGPPLTEPGRTSPPE